MFFSLTRIAFPNLPGLADLVFELSRDVAPSLGTNPKGSFNHGR